MHCESTAKQVTAALWPSRTRNGGELHESESIRSAERRKIVGETKETARREREALKDTSEIPMESFRQKLRSNTSPLPSKGLSEAFIGVVVGVLPP